METIKDYTGKVIHFSAEYVIEIFTPPLMSQNRFGKKVVSTCDLFKMSPEGGFDILYYCNANEVNAISGDKNLKISIDDFLRWQLERMNEVTLYHLAAKTDKNHVYDILDEEEEYEKDPDFDPQSWLNENIDDNSNKQKGLELIKRLRTEKPQQFYDQIIQGIKDENTGVITWLETEIDEDAINNLETVRELYANWSVPLMVVSRGRFRPYIDPENTTGLGMDDASPLFMYVRNYDEDVLPPVDLTTNQNNEVHESIPTAALLLFIEQCKSVDFVRLYSSTWLLSQQLMLETSPSFETAAELDELFATHGENCRDHLVAFRTNEDDALEQLSLIDSRLRGIDPKGNHPPSVVLMNLLTGQVVAFGLGRKGNFFSQTYPRADRNGDDSILIDFSGVPEWDVELQTESDPFIKRFVEFDFFGFTQRFLSAVYTYGFYSYDYMLHHPGNPDDLQSAIDAAGEQSQTIKFDGEEIERAEAVEHVVEMRELLRQMERESSILDDVFPDPDAFPIDPCDY